MPPIIINGIPRPFWRAYRDRIGQYIKRCDLKPALTPAELLLEELKPLIGREQSLRIRIPPFPGDRGPHLHYDGKLYLLTDKQWKEFSQPILKEMSQKLMKAATVPFEEFMNVTDTLNKMGELANI